MAYDTGNPIPSIDPRDLSDNAENFDLAINSGEMSFTDRLGNDRRTYAWMEGAATGLPAIDAAARAEAARDAALLSRGVFETTAKALSLGVVSLASLAAGAGGTDGTFALAFSGGAGTGAAGVFTVAGGSVVSYTITASGDSYTSAPAVSFSASAGLTGASATAVLAINVNDGEYFSTPSADVSTSILLYRRVVNSAVLQKTYPSQSMNSVTVNKGKNFPARLMVRNSVSSAPDNRNFLVGALLDFRVSGARAGYYYRISFFKNGSAVTGEYRDGWTIEEIAKLNFETSDNPVNVVLHYRDPAPDIPRGAGVQTVAIDSPVVGGMTFYITVDSAALPAIGTSVNMQGPANGGYSWIIDPSRYDYTAGAAPAGEASGAIRWTRAAGHVDAVWNSTDRMFRLRFGPNGFNSLPNIISISRAPLGDPDLAAWTVIASGTTDWLPPMVVAAQAGGDAGASIYTGGNHGSNGDASGSQTAQNVLFLPLADNAPMGIGSSGWAESLSFVVVNEVMAYNTITFPRYVIRETFNCKFSAGSLEVACQRRALEGVNVTVDNGPQTVTVGFQGDQLIYGGQESDRVTFDNNVDSGEKLDFPDAWMLVLQSANGQQSTWVDRAFGKGDSSSVAGGRPLVRFGGGTNTKAYHAIVAGDTLALASGDYYEWRGGYAWQAPGVEPSGLDSVVPLHVGGQAKIAYAISGHDWTLA
jgi:hypothetical protein